MKDTKIITIFNQKGGPGKSTLGTMFANQSAYEEGKKVLVIDTDNRQQSIYRQRKKDEIEGAEKTGLYDILLMDPLVIPQEIEAFDGEYDYIFLDLPGNIGQEGVINSLLVSDKLIVPTKIGSPDLDSTDKMLEDVFPPIQEALKNHDAKLEMQFLINCIEKRYYSTLSGLEKLRKSITEHFELDTLGIPLFNGVVYKENVLEQEYQTVKPYIVPHDPRRYEQLYKEFHKFINA